MKIIIHGKNIDLTVPLKEYVEEKVSSLDKYFKSPGFTAEARVELGRDSKHHKTGMVYYAEINLKLGKSLLRAVADHMDVRMALDKAKNEIETQASKLKSRSTTARRKVRKLKSK